MGNWLSFPALDKTTTSGGDNRILYTSCAMQGWRTDMEDELRAILPLASHGESDENNAFFAIYDGHNGNKTSKFAAENVHKHLVAQDTYHANQYETALKMAFLETDKALRNVIKCQRGQPGSTAVVALLTHDAKIYVANIGDSRSVLCVKGHAKDLSMDHKPNRKDEQARIEKAGGHVSKDDLRMPRVNGIIAMSRAFGHFYMKNNEDLSVEEQVMTANPEITSHDISSEDEFLVLASDGIWDSLKSQDVVDFIRRQVCQGTELSNIPGLICDHCLFHGDAQGDAPGQDNMTMISGIIAWANERGMV